MRYSRRQADSPQPTAGAQLALHLDLAYVGRIIWRDFWSSLLRRRRGAALLLKKGQDAPDRDGL